MSFNIPFISVDAALRNSELLREQAESGSVSPEELTPDLEMALTNALKDSMAVDFIGDIVSGYDEYVGDVTDMFIAADIKGLVVNPFGAKYEDIMDDLEAVNEYTNSEDEAIFDQKLIEDPTVAVMDLLK